MRGRYSLPLAYDCCEEPLNTPDGLVVPPCNLAVTSMLPVALLLATAKG